ncbi:MAG: pyruvate kinase [Ghiorsea sp.]
MKLIPALKLLKHKRTKIIATIGPASSDESIMRQLIEKGVNVFRLNMSHGEHHGHKENYERIRKVAQSCGKHIAILADLCGPKIRTGVFKNGSITLEQGHEVVVTMRDVVGEQGIICSQYKSLAQDVKVGNRIFLADGVMELEILRVEGTEVYCLVKEGGVLGDHKGINLPDASVSAPSMTEKDFKDAEFAVGLGVDFLALSFVRHADDVKSLRQWLEARGKNTSIISKIERPEALDDACDIIAASDAIMVARGDLGVELPPEQVPVAQQMLIDEARRQNRPVIVATQILESMIENARPTRAETTDIFHSVSSSTDAVMLSGETAVGAHPVAAVEIMSKVIYNAEAYLWKNSAFASSALAQDNQQDVFMFGDAVARSTALLSRDLMVRGIIVISSSGATSATVSSARPEAPVLGVATQAATCRKMNLFWGVIPVLVEAEAMEDNIKLSKDVVAKHNLASKGDSILLVQGFNHNEELSHPSITVLKV